ncbi:MAG: molybdopterin synthase sulfur carrier subunit [Pelagibacteraceae bacterium]|nr:molybdopterin synthase sulfur carrier subunit [Pelagibacteraceae bacterium]
MAFCYYYYFFWLQLYKKRIESYLKIKIKYFSWIRIKLNKSEEFLNIDDKTNFEELKKILISNNNLFSEIFKDNSIKIFINFKEIENHQINLSNGDELAILPPVTGG